MCSMDKNDWWKIYARAREELTKIPDVIGVGLGIKEVKGQLSGEVALIVYVREKIAKDQLSPSDTIPPEFAGMVTDVQHYQDIESFGSTTIQGGVQIRRFPDDKGKPKPGTLGYIATRTDNNVNVMLSCEHVLLFQRIDERSVFHPDVSRCCGIHKNKVGTVIYGKSGNLPYDNGTGIDDYFVDAAIALIDSGVDALKHIPNVGDVTGSTDISASPIGPETSTISVKKFGAATRYTEGTIDDVAFPQGPARRRFRIRPTATGSFPFVIRWKVPLEDVAEHLTKFPLVSLGGTATQISEDEIEFRVNVFTTPGDSGAAVVDSSGGIVGIIVSGSVYELEAFQGGKLGVGIVPTGVGIACDIEPILREMRVRIDPSTTPSSALSLLVPGDEVSRWPDGVQQINSQLEVLEKQLDKTPMGRQLIAIARRHSEEVADLVHHRRRVLVAWHRGQGPAFANLFLRAIANPDDDLATEVNGVTLQASRERIYQALMAEGSASLRETLKENKDLLYDLLDNSHSLNELVARTTLLPARQSLMDDST